MPDQDDAHQRRMKFNAFLHDHAEELYKALKRTLAVGGLNHQPEMKREFLELIAKVEAPDEEE